MDYIHKSIGQALEAVANKYPSQDALVHTEEGIRYSYKRLLNHIDRIADGFLKYGIQPGDKVALWASNVSEWLPTLLGLAKIGGVTVPIDPGATKENVFYILEQSETCGLIIAHENSDETFKKVAIEARGEIDTLKNIYVISDANDGDMICWPELMTARDDADKEALTRITHKVNPQDPVAIMYTSGTTGQPKGVVLDHLGLINKSMFATERQGINSEDKLCLFFPLFHQFGNTCIALAGLLRGAALIMPCRIFDPVKILNSIPAETCTAIYGSPSMLISLVDHPAFQKKEWGSLKKGIIGGAPCPLELMRRIVEDIGVSNITVAYGITEASSWITMTHPDDPIDLRVSTIGTSLPCNEVKIVDPATGKALPPNQPGELCTRGFLMKEYYKRPAATTAAIDRNMWFHTGDLGLMDEQGYVRITGRLKDVIVRDGIEIYPVEVEEAIYMLTEVSEVQVFGFPDPKRGQEVAAWIKLKEGCHLPLDSICAHVQTEITAEKVPKYYKIVSGFPMTGSGKVQKFKMAQIAEKEYSQG